MLWNALWFKRNAPSKKHHYLSGAFERVAVMLSVTKSHKTGKWPTNHCKGTSSRRSISTNSLRVVFFLRAFGVDARRWVGWILNPPRRSFKLRALVDRQRPMKNVALDSTTILQLDAGGTDGAFDAAVNCEVLRNDPALDLCAIADRHFLCCYSHASDRTTPIQDR